ncbi:kelch-like protein diablo [Montipora capricornis]|uniref:kelch-like protein diablo n=1 Tax=Montipora foliosa TaxID=591990 RepID=UPI0035F1EE3B
MDDDVDEDGGEIQTFLHQQHAGNVLSRLNDLLQRDELCDVTISVEGRAIKAHRAVLAASSQYFNAMFTRKMSEQNQATVEIKGVDFISAQMLIQFAYTAQLTITDSTVQNLFLAADLLQFKWAKDSCVQFIMQQIDIANCLGVRALAERHSCKAMYEAATRYIMENFTKVTKTEDFQTLGSSEVIELISHNEVKVCSEMEVFDACIAWIEYSTETRKCHLSEFLKTIRLPFIPLKQLQENVAEHSLVKNDIYSHDIAEEAIIFHFDHAGVQMRHCYAETIYLLGGETSFMKEVKSVECYNCETMQWEMVKSMTEARASFTVATLQEKLYVIGGYRRGRKLNSMECYDPAQNAWLSLPPMSKCQGDMRAAVLDGYIYVAGGSSEGLLTCSYVERYSPITEQWQVVSSMHRQRRRFALAVLESHIYAVGGFDDKRGDLKHVEYYDAGTDTWTEVKPMQCCRYDFGAVSLSGYLYAVGGANGRRGSLNTVERFDPQTNEWSMVASLKHCRGGVSVAVHCGKIFAMNGMNEYMSIVDSTESYNEVQDKWSSLPACTHTARFSAAAIVYRPIISLHVKNGHHNGSCHVE